MNRSTGTTDDRPPVSGEPSTEHEHDWVDAQDDETGWYCPTCGVTEYPSDEHEQLANDLYCVVAQPETIWWDDLPPEMQKGWIRAADLVKQRVDAAAPRAEELHAVREVLTKLIRQYHGVAHSQPRRPGLVGSWLYCDDRWCSDMRQVLSVESEESHAH